MSLVPVVTPPAVIRVTLSSGSGSCPVARTGDPAALADLARDPQNPPHRS